MLELGWHELDGSLERYWGWVEERGDRLFFPV
jgi:hypothetical protein